MRKGGSAKSCPLLPVVCLKGPTGKFVEIHGTRFLCDGIYTGVGFIFTETTLQLDSGKYLSDVIENGTVSARDAPTRFDIKSTGFESFNVNMSLSVASITYDGASIEDRYRPGRNYLVLNSSRATIDITFSIPYTVEGERNGTVELLLNHRRDFGGIIDVYLNSQHLISRYGGVPTNAFETQNMTSIALGPLSGGENNLSIRLSQGSPGNYYFSDAALVFKDNTGYIKQQNSIYALGVVSGSSYNGGILEDKYRRGNPYLSIEGGVSWSKITFTVKEELLGIGIGNCVIKIQHRKQPGASIDIFLNGSLIEQGYDNIPSDSFGTSTFSVHSNDLKASNELVIRSKNGGYYISDVAVDVISLLPDVTKENFDTIVQEAPYWFFIPFLPLSPEELKVLFVHHNMKFISVAYQVDDTINKARDFHRELISTDLPRKNALRHAYWTAMLAQRFDLHFALDLTTAHEDGHVDLTIEGPFDHVTDKINNAIGSLLGIHTSRAKSLQEVIDAAWDNRELAYVRDFRETVAGQTAKVFWQGPLNTMAKKYNVVPRFTETEKNTLKKMGVNIPNVPIIR
ncbi:hypothetical protein D9613_011007 [Agrocybe pediades]|uniref:DUF6973 domain-containing protein n=1 Tax=Agrocybe pediades TaxID=84607 RepID=A0A8H4VM20_9AGAR|nr:hypothetical protein D9613_011007 [Agrocybe pediades]